ncbi:F-box only protein 43 isoform X3 [Girardinichthys multiradiatus]|uniref:F-box only protein 43 isoform X3 n=1 Tax=Girardinichthys multiradiatus TaxID=208333 RepID=UPI001FAD1F1B|nr:F-box only protein 43 isoform X3 [Girardinichthys multiradiatus]
MQCTPTSNVILQSYKGQRCYEDCSDSGYSGWFQSPRTITGVDFSGFLSPSEINETPKENLRLPVTPKEQSKESVRVLGKDTREAASVLSWCETPKLNRRGTFQRHKLLTSKPALVKDDSTGSPFTTNAESFSSKRSEHWLSASFDSLDFTAGGATSSLNMGQDLALSGRKRRILFTQVRTSTHEDGKLNTYPLPSFEGSVLITEADFRESISAHEIDKLFPSITKENFQSPVSSETDILCDRTGAFYTPSFTQTPKNTTRSVYEDSGFSSLTLDKSQDSSVDHDGSFQELLLPASKGTSQTPNLTDGRRRSRLQRHHRLSTLKEGATPCSTMSAKCFNTLVSTKNDSHTPLSATSSKLENATPHSTDPAYPAMTPLRTTPVNLSLTPALQLVHAICQHKVQMSSGQSLSLKDELKFAAALTRTPVMFRTAMPLAGLIGRKMGLGKVDILTELKKRNLRHILANIFSKLNSECLYRCGLVCKSWNEIIQQDHQASLRRRTYLSELEEALEHSVGVLHISEAETRSALLKRSALKRIQARSRTSSYCTPQSANSTLTPSEHGTLSTGSSSKQEKFMEVAKTLFSDQSLKPCPRCQHPARCHSVKREGVCSRGDCGFQFCILCLCAFHGSRECGSQSAGRRKKDKLLPGSVESKRNVRRL